MGIYKAAWPYILVYQTRQEWRLNPPDTSQIHDFVSNKHIHASTVNVDLEAIQDATNVVNLLRLITISQIHWYLVGLFARSLPRD